ncbi:MAG: family 43 glycosylhydrolase [Gemmatimonadaceae bacterium]|nr:family 43 glycosylhydrolase [Gemmatimonadaceae bacterium]
MTRAARGAVRRLALATLALASSVHASASAQSSGIRTYTNPIDIEYKYNWEGLNEGVSYRSGADPAVVNHRGEYFLFVTVSGGYWRSRDLVHWQFVVPSRWPFDDVVAPAAISVGDTLLLMQSATAPRPILYSTRPATGQLEFYNRILPQLPYAVAQGSERPGQLVPSDSIQPGPWDPALFRDDDGRWFLYWGSSNVYPIYGIELDPVRRLAYKAGARPVKLLSLHPEVHGWERFGQDHRDTIRPYVEGAWMTKHAGRYYLQYAAPGTEYNVYANGTYVGTSPLGPFTYAPSNPVAYKPGGFVVGAGHGSTFQDNFGNYWNTGTPWIGVNGTFERRIAMFPAGFDADGQMFASTRFGDFPHFAPTRKWKSPDELFTGWMLLSYRKPVVASSARDSFPASNVTDENARSWWVARDTASGATLTIDLGGDRTVRAVQVNYADYHANRFASDSAAYTQFRISASRDGRRWRTIADATRERRDRANAYVELPAPVIARWVRWEHVHVGIPNLAVSDLRVFGTAAGMSPPAPAGVMAQRTSDPRGAVVRWEPVPGAVGYNVRWGIAPAKLYQTYQRWADRGAEVEIRALTAGQEYWFAVEAFDEHGVSPLSAPVRVAP